jgi:phosphatidylethanolamine/phosphatidyl-N-methylethanolamine N-methyltransferase
MLTRLKLIATPSWRSPGAPFVQFTYSVAPPIPEIAAGRVHRSLRADLDEPSAARVWVYRKG